MRDDSRFLSWVVELWTLVLNFLMFSASLSTLEVVPIALQTSLFTPGVSILLIQLPLIFLLSLDVLMILFVLLTDSSCGPITSVSDWCKLSWNIFVSKSCLLELVKMSVTMLLPMFVLELITPWVMPCPMIPTAMAAGLTLTIPTDRLLIPPTMWVSVIGVLLASTGLLESLIVSTRSSDS